MKERAKFSAAVVLLICLIAVCFGAGTVLRGEIREGRETSGQAAAVRVILDPGHGGMDAGKTGVSGRKRN